VRTPRIHCSESALQFPDNTTFMFLCHVNTGIVREQSKMSSSQSQSHFTTGGLPPISPSFRQAPRVSRLEHFFFFFATEPLRAIPYVTSFLMTGWLCLL
jgi:hypothetical protein